MAKLMPRSLVGRMTTACALFAAAACMLGLLMYSIVHEEIEKHLDRRSHSEAEALIAAAGSRGVEGVAAAVRTREATHTAGDLGYIVLGSDGRRTAGTLEASVPAPGYTEFLHYRLADGGKGIAQAYRTQIPGGGSLIVATDRSAVDEMDRLIFAIFGVMVGLTATVGVVATILLRRTIKRRLLALGGTAEAIMAGDLSRRMPHLHDAEFDQISQVINRMLERIEELLGNLRQLSTDLAHDIRSPLNRVRGGLEAFDRKQGGDEMATAAIAEIDDLLELLGGLLGISEIEGFSVRQRFVALDLARLADDVVDGYQPAAEAANLALTFAGDPAGIWGDPALLRRCVANLIDNCLLHASGATRIEVSVSIAANHCLLTVTDDGIGVPAEQREAIFRRFVRLDVSRSTPGHGLGLNMVAAIMRAHRGTAQAKATSTGHAIELILPLRLE